MILCVPCLFGLESVLSHEIKRLGGEDVVTSDGRVTFKGDLSLVVRSNIWLRTAERVCIVLGSFVAQSFTELFDRMVQLPLEDFIGRNDAFPVKGWSLKSALYSVPSCQAIIKKAAAKRLGKIYGIETLPETGAPRQIQFSIYKDTVTIMLDTSGDGLYKRGYRSQSGQAPIKETLAAGICDLARIREGDIVVDPMCGSGTLLIESALRALNIAPGLSRSFAAEKWDVIPASVWREQREHALECVSVDRPFEAVGYDNDPEAIVITMENAKRAGVSRFVKVKRQDISNLRLVGGETLLCNPPYGERLASAKEAEALYKTMGQVMNSVTGGRYIITPNEEFEQFFHKKADRKRKLYNGMIECKLYMYFES